MSSPFYTFEPSPPAPKEPRITATGALRLREARADLTGHGAALTGHEQVKVSLLASREAALLSYSSMEAAIDPLGGSDADLQKCHLETFRVQVLERRIAALPASLARIKSALANSLTQLQIIFSDLELPPQQSANPGHTAEGRLALALEEIDGLLRRQQ